MVLSIRDMVGFHQNLESHKLKERYVSILHKLPTHEARTNELYDRSIKVYSQELIEAFKETCRDEILPEDYRWELEYIIHAFESRPMLRREAFLDLINNSAGIRFACIKKLSDHLDEEVSDIAQGVLYLVSKNKIFRKCLALVDHEYAKIILQAYEEKYEQKDSSSIDDNTLLAAIKEAVLDLDLVEL